MEYFKSWRKRQHDIYSIKVPKAVKAFTAIAMSAKQHPTKHQQVRWDTDSKSIHIDNCASFSITNDIKDFETNPESIDKQVKGIGGLVKEIKRGTIIWGMEDDTGLIHHLKLPGSLYLPQSPSKLLSPQHWAQAAKVLDPTDEVQCITLADKVILKWGTGQFTKTVPITKSQGNVAVFTTAPGYKAFVAFEQEAELFKDKNYDFDPEVPNITNKRNDIDELEREGGQIRDIYQDNESQRERRSPLLMEFDEVPNSDQSTTWDNLNNGTNMDNASIELLHYHYKLNHLSMRKIQSMAKEGLLPSKFKTCLIPACPSCLFGKATRRPWRDKPKKDSKPSKLRIANHPGQTISVDQMESNTPGLIAQMKGSLTTKRYKVATIFVDNYSGYSFIYFQNSTSGEETLQAKITFERFSSKCGVRVTHYHADNGRFADKLFREHALVSNQLMTFCGVNAHFQNAVAERRIRILQDNARTMLIHAKSRWPDAITSNLWPYAIRLANDVFNATPETGRITNQSPNELFYNTEIRPNLKYFQPFGCPAYVLDNRMQAGQKLPKWDLRARVGVYLGMSNQHARSVALILNIKTGHVSPQFHVKFDPLFTTVNPKYGNLAPEIKWQEEAEFKGPTVPVTSILKRDIQWAHSIHQLQNKAFQLHRQTQIYMTYNLQILTKLMDDQF